MNTTTLASTAQKARTTARRVVKGGPRRVRRLWRGAVERVRGDGKHDRGAGASSDTSPQKPLTPAEALQQNGFYVFRGLFSPEECQAIGSRLKGEFGIDDDRQRTSIDAAARFEIARELLFDPRILESVRAGLGSGARFQQVADVQYNHDHLGWHRDSPYRGEDCSASPDWSDTSAPYKVAKIIMYFESDNAGMGMLIGSHLDPVQMDAEANRAKEYAGHYTVIARDDEPNRRFEPGEKARPAAWAAQVGDALLFDERMYHCGRRVEGDKVISDRDGRKLTLSYVFGDDNAHSARMYSYFRYARTDLKYVDLPEPLLHKLDEHGLTPSAGWGNYFEGAPEELRGAFLRDPAMMDKLIDRYSKAIPSS